MKKIIAPLLLIFLSGLLTTIWFHKGLLFAGGEEGIPFYNLAKNNQLFAYTWRDYSTGYPVSTDLARIPFFGLIQILGRFPVSNVTLQALSFFMLMAIGTVSVYFLIQLTIGEELNVKYRRVALIGSIFYLLNPYSMVQIWGRGLYNQFFPFALLPLFLVLFIAGIKRRNVVYGFMALISSFILSMSFGQPSYVISLWLVVVTYVIFYLLTTNKLAERKYAIFYFLAIFTLWLLMHSWWIWPLFKTFGATTDKLGDLEYNIGSLKGISRDSPITVVIRLVHKFVFAGIYGNIYLTLPFRLMSWLIPTALLFSISVFKRLRYFKFYIGLFLISLFVILGTNMPLGWLFLWLFKNVSVFQVFRNPYEKMGLVLIIAYTPFFAIGVVELSIKIQAFFKKIPSALVVCAFMFLVFGVYVWPMWTGQFAGGVTINPWIRVPDYYQLANEWIKNQDVNSRIIQFPLNPGDGVLYKWDHSYQGIEPSEFLFSNTSVGRNIASNKIFYNVLLERFGVLQKNAFGPDPDITKSDFRSENLYQELAKLNVRYIVVHHDIDEKLSSMKTAQETTQYLAKEQNITKVKTFGQLDIYEVKLPDEIGHIYSPDVKVSYEKINPTLYKFNIMNSRKPFDLFFLERYDPEWKLTVDNRTIETHSTVFSYANTWKIDKEGTYSGYIKYIPQDFAKDGAKVSLITTIGLEAIIILIIFRKLHEKNK